ncbi:MAG TPA: S46 family peptidase [Vicinamibacterales bacterium]|nr:S46 family peptidase [Vicinamibacterales bacterium]
MWRTRISEHAIAPRRAHRVMCCLLAALAVATTSDRSVAARDEGMWTFDNLPVKVLQEKYGFTPTAEWLDHVRLSSVRFNDGGSGSFVSANGLVLTNHHVAAGQLQKLSTPKRDLLKNGFYAGTRAQELKCPDLELNVLASMENVTERVRAAVKPGQTDAQALEARRGEIAKIEKESLDKTGLRSDVVTLYAGGEYWLYRYQKYTDVRLVFAPEQQAAFFGGDPDNFTYPRYDLDLAVFRVYDKGRTMSSSHYLKWSAKGAAAGDLVFVSGNPGTTDRLKTLSQLEFLRDVLYPISLATIERRLAALRSYAARGAEQARQTSDFVFSLENALKALTGEARGLADPEIFEKKRSDEKSFRAIIDANAEWKAAYGSAWDDTARAQVRARALYKPFRFRALRGSSLAGLAFTIVRYAQEIEKPDAQRLDGFHDSQLESLKFGLLSPAPQYPDMDIAVLADSLQQSADELGADDPFIKAALGGKTAAEVARAAIGGSKVGDPALRKSLVEGGKAAVMASTDPLIALARNVEPIIRETGKSFEDEVESIEATAGEKLGRARFAAYGTSVYPDATFTPRLTFGSVRGYPMNGTQAPPVTTFYGLYDRAQSFGMKPPYNLPARFTERRARLTLSTPLNFVSDCDIIGGNSGSPVINRAGELVGLIFDGNIESLIGNVVYNGNANRAVAVHSAGMIEALRKLYDAGALADELQGVRKPTKPVR